MQIGASFDGMSSLADVMKMAAAADEAGAASLWFAQHMGYRDALISAAACCAATKHATIVPTAISPYLWPPMPSAMAAASLSELAPGRLTFCVSVGNVLNLKESGLEPVKPVRVMREYVDTLRRLFAGEVVTLEGEIFRLHGARMAFKAEVPPIYVASTGPKMLELAGEIGDGVLLSAGLTLASCKTCIDHAATGASRVGRDPAKIRKAGFIYFGMSEDGVAARKAMLRRLAFLFRSRGHAENIKSSGLDIDHDAIIAAVAARDIDKAANLLPDAAADAFTVVGTPSECHEKLEAYLSIGLDEPIISLSGSVEEYAQSLAFLKDVSQWGRH
jgi:5,10-methylenetetrahydromethanopterin reductase